MSQVSFYELAVLLPAHLGDDLNGVVDKLKRMIADEGAKIVKEDNWGVRDLAYKIKQQDKAVYIFYDLEAPATTLATLEAKFNIDDYILRFQFYKPDLKALKKAQETPAAREALFSKHEEPEEGAGV